MQTCIDCNRAMPGNRCNSLRTPTRVIFCCVDALDCRRSTYRTIEATDPTDGSDPVFIEEKTVYDDEAHVVYPRRVYARSATFHVAREFKSGEWIDVPVAIGHTDYRFLSAPVGIAPDGAVFQSEELHLDSQSKCAYFMRTYIYRERAMQLCYSYGMWDFVVEDGPRRGFNSGVNRYLGIQKSGHALTRNGDLVHFDMLVMATDQVILARVIVDSGISHLFEDIESIVRFLREAGCREGFIRSLVPKEPIDTDFDYA